MKERYKNIYRQMDTNFEIVTSIYENRERQEDKKDERQRDIEVVAVRYLDRDREIKKKDRRINRDDDTKNKIDRKIKN